MPTRQEYIDKVADYFNGNYAISSGTSIPNISDIGHGKVGKEMELAMLFIDIRGSTKLVDGFRRQTAAKMYKSFLWGTAQIANSNGGALRSFNGDGLLVVFAGGSKCSMAVKSALQMSWFMQEVLQPKVESYLQYNQKLTDIEFGFGIGIHTGKVLIVRAGMKGEANNDLVWVGNATNYAAKLGSETSYAGRKIRITPDVYKKLNDNSKYATVNGLKIDMWEKCTSSERLGKIDLYRTDYLWGL
jgi:adenylate cyclase